MPGPRYRFVASLFTEEGAPLDRMAISPDWLPATESVRFTALRQGRILPHGAAYEHVLPIWDTKAGQPFVSGVQVLVDDCDGGTASCDISLDYFSALAQDLGRELIRNGKLKEGDRYRYRIMAFPITGAGSTAPSGTPSDWVVVEIPQSPVCGERPLRRFRESAQFSGGADAGDFPVFIPVDALIRADELKAAAMEHETGGILIGYLWKDTESPEIFAEVSALVPAIKALEQSTRLTFTTEAWDAVHAAIQLRNRGEIYLGWFHTHPSKYWSKCQECPAEKRRNCPFGVQFFSADDVALHRTVFSSAFQTALVSGDRPLADGGWETVHTLYGWRNGTVASRDFWLLPPNAAGATRLAPAEGQSAKPAE